MSRIALNAEVLIRLSNWVPRHRMTGETVAMMGPRFPVRSVTDFSHGCRAPATRGVCAALTACQALPIPWICLDRAICFGDSSPYALQMAICSALYAVACLTPLATATL